MRFHLKRRLVGPVATGVAGVAASVAMIVAVRGRATTTTVHDDVSVVAQDDTSGDREVVIDELPPERPPVVPRAGWTGRADRFQQRHPTLAFPVAVALRYDRDRAIRLGALIAYYGFFSLFPGMLALTTILRFFLEDRPELRRQIATSAISQFPVLGDSVTQSATTALSGSAVVLVIGLLGAYWAGLGAMGAAQDMMNDIWALQRHEHPNFLHKRIRSTLMLVLIIVLLVGSTVIGQGVIYLVPGTALNVILFALTVSLNIFIFMIAFLVLASSKLTWRHVRPGAIFAGVGYTGLQMAANLFVTSAVMDAEDAYGTFIVVLGLMSWLYLLAQVATVGTCVNVVSARRQWPRSVFGGDE